MLTAAQRLSLRRVIAVMNSKGGVLKTSITVNVGGILAEGGYRVLIVDLDPQGNQSRDTGIKDTSLNDRGQALAEAIMTQGTIQPARGVRNNLDLAVGGPELHKVAVNLVAMAMQGKDPSSALAERLVEIAPQYDVILIDCPPGEPGLQTQALVASRWIVIPTQPDDASIDGLEGLAERVVEIRHLNPDVAPLGVVLAPLKKSATRIATEVREKVVAIMGDGTPVFRAVIREAQATAVAARKRGQLIIEVANDAKNEDRFAWKKALRDRHEVELSESSSGGPRLPDSAAGLAGDYLQLTEEILEILGANEQRLAEEVAQ